MKKIIYLDNAATTKLSDAAKEAVLPYLSEGYGNPSSIYSVGQEAKKAIEDARTIVAEAIGALPGEVYFTDLMLQAGSIATGWVSHVCEIKWTLDG